MNICFVMYPWGNIAPETDTTLRIIHEAASRGHKIGLITPNNLTIRKSITYGFCKVIEKNVKVSQSITTFYKKVTFKEQLLPLAGFDAIFIRTNPPMDTNMLNFLDSVRGDTFIINDIEGMRKANNKLYPAAFDENIIPLTYVSKNKEYLKKVIKESDQDKMILKPLDSFKGSGVIVLEKQAASNINSLLDFYIEGKAGSNAASSYVILQEFLEDAKNGDIRVLMLNGKPIGAMRRRPADGDIRSNICAGGQEEKHVLTKKEKRLCEIIGDKLIKDGLYFVGLDIIQDKLIEINVCSPGGITRINKLNKVKLQKKVLDFVEDVVEKQERRLTRRAELKKSLLDH